MERRLPSSETVLFGARGAGTATEPLGVRVMQEKIDAGAIALRSATQQEATERLRGDFANGRADKRVAVGADGLTYSCGDVSDLRAVIDFDSASVVPTTFGWVNGGAVCGDRELAERFVDQSFRI